MQQVTVDAARWLRDGDGSWLAFRVGSDKTAMDVCDSLKAGKEYNLTLKRKGYHNVRSYLSSSDYDTAQMSQLIELVVADCKQNGIETMTPRELDALVSRWGEVSV